MPSTPLSLHYHLISSRWVHDEIGMKVFRPSGPQTDADEFGNVKLQSPRPRSHSAWLMVIPQDQEF